jgi:hypothetical protein
LRKYAAAARATSTTASIIVVLYLSITFPNP